jgi:hypothetical protein
MTLPKGWHPPKPNTANTANTVTHKKSARQKLLDKVTQGWLSVIGLTAYAIVYVLLITIIAPTYNIPVVYASFFIVFVSLSLNLAWYKGRDASEDSQPPKSDDVKDIRGDSPALIFGLIYGIVVSLAITEALDTFNMAQENVFEKAKIASPSPRVFLNLMFQNHENWFNLIGFFSVTIPFVHAGYVFLTTISAELIKKTETRPVQIFTIFLFSFIQAIFLFFTAKNIDNTPQFIFLLTLALLVDIIWAVISMRISVHKVFDEALHRRTKKVKDIPSNIAKEIIDQIPLEWLHLNTLTVGFLIVILIVNPNLDYRFASFLLLCVFVFRTISDYILGWNAIYVRRLKK